MTSHFLTAIFDQVASKPIVPKAAAWKAAALATEFAIAMLAYPAYAALTTGGDTVQGLYDALLGKMKNGRSLGQSGRFARLEPVYTSILPTSPQWPACRLARPGPRCPRRSGTR